MTTPPPEEQPMHHIFKPCKHGVPTDEPCVKCTEESKSEELQKVIERYEELLKDCENPKIETTLILGSDLQMFVSANKQLQQIEKERDELKIALHQTQFGKYGNMELADKCVNLEQQLSQQSADLEKMVEALKKAAVSIEDCAKYFDCFDTTRKALLNDLGKINNALSTPTAQKYLKK